MELFCFEIHPNFNISWLSKSITEVAMKIFRYQIWQKTYNLQLFRNAIQTNNHVGFKKLCACQQSRLLSGHKKTPGNFFIPT